MREQVCASYHSHFVSKPSVSPSLQDIQKQRQRNRPNGKGNNQAHLPDSGPRFFDSCVVSSHLPGSTLLMSFVPSSLVMSHHLNGVPIVPVQSTSLLLNFPVPYLMAFFNECPKPIACRSCCNHLCDCCAPEVHCHFCPNLLGKFHCGPVICFPPLLEVSFVKPLTARPKNVG
jgi:hypothetical protein